MPPFATFRAERLADAAQAAAQHFERHPPDPALLRRALERPGLRAQVLAATLRFLSAITDLDANESVVSVHGQLRSVFVQLGRLARLLRLQAFLSAGRARPGAATSAEMSRFTNRLDDLAYLLLTDRRAEGCAGSARLGLGLVHHILTGSHLPV
ncbi:hypothetical protein [Kitasatospora sp. MBT63]|uniref:hypothetical protein n=1 Tax=Kitasatospora sp. MBT63 TaxID=1444768 RepID=UPI0005399C07|nr:hypothetical protein [Kitasatospora sp. MBT63]